MKSLADQRRMKKKPPIVKTKHDAATAPAAYDRHRVDSCRGPNRLQASCFSFTARQRNSGHYRSICDDARS